MKTSVYSIIALALTVSMACACSKEVRDLPAPGQTITVSASLPDAATRVAPIDREDAPGLSWAWEEGDAINLIGKTSSVLDINEGFTAKNATFSGKPVSGDTFDIVYPGSFASVSAMDGMTFTEHSQKDLASKDHLQYFAALQGLKAFDSFEFSKPWAEANGATIRQGGVLKIEGTLPSETMVISKLTIKASDAIFHADNGETMTNVISITFGEQALPENKSFTAWLTTSWHDTAIPAGTTIQFSAAAGDFTWLFDLTFSEDKVIKSGAVNTVTIPADGWYNTGRYSGGAGTSDSPWLISKPEQMLYIGEDLIPGGIRYYKLAADIDMSGIEGWVPLNYEDPYDKEIDFDGDGHTISGFKCDYPNYPSFFGVLYGSCRNVSFVNALIDATTNSGCGILGGYGGTGTKKAVVDKVHVQGNVNFTGNKTGIGGMFGQLGNAEISRSSADVNVVSGKNYVGGLFGYSSGPATVTDCWTSGSVQGNQRVGGIAGGSTKKDLVVRNCYSLSSVAANFGLGGIAAHCNMDQKEGTPEESMPNNVFEKCIAWNVWIKANSVSSGDKSHYSAGAVVGFTSIRNTLTDCMRKADLEFVEYSDLFGLYDQENASPEVPLVVQAVEGASYNYPYHGKAAPAGATLSQVAQSLGWSADIWDFSGDVPVLK